MSRLLGPWFEGSPLMILPRMGLVLFFATFVTVTLSLFLRDKASFDALALVPFALDKQVIVERKVDRRDQISGIVKLQRGSLSTEIQHIRDTELKTVLNQVALVP